MSTITAKKADLEKSWFMVDLENQVLGRAATEIARILRGKHKAIYPPGVDPGHFVIVLNVEKVKLTADKPNKKIYYSHSTHPGGVKDETQGAVLHDRHFCRWITGGRSGRRTHRLSFRHTTVGPAAGCGPDGRERGNAWSKNCGSRRNSRNWSRRW